MENHVQDGLDEIFEKWDLQTGDPQDIKSALYEAYMIGAAEGGMDSQVFNSALEFIDRLEIVSRLDNIPKMQ